MRVDVVTIFPEYLTPLSLSLLGRARDRGVLDVRVHDLREWTSDRHRTVDDTPAGGGAGMVMAPEPWAQALDTLLGPVAPGGVSESAAVAAAEPADGGPVPAAGSAGGALVVVPSPAGTPFTQAMARELATRDHLVFACGRYEGIDERVLEYAGERAPVLRVSLGDYVLNGGEVAVLAIVEAVGRLLPGVVGNAESLVEESHEDGLLEYPVYTKPAVWRGRAVPDVLVSGHHGRIARWRRDERLRRTARVRPDLLARLPVAATDAADRAVLASEGWLPDGDRFRAAVAPVAD